MIAPHTNIKIPKEHRINAKKSAIYTGEQGLFENVHETGYVSFQPSTGKRVEDEGNDLVPHVRVMSRDTHQGVTAANVVLLQHQGSKHTSFVRRRCDVSKLHNKLDLSLQVDGFAKQAIGTKVLQHSATAPSAKYTLTFPYKSTMLDKTAICELLQRTGSDLVGALQSLEIWAFVWDGKATNKQLTIPFWKRVSQEAGVSTEMYEDVPLKPAPKHRSYLGQALGTGQYSPNLSWVIGTVRFNCDFRPIMKFTTIIFHGNCLGRHQ